MVVYFMVSSMALYTCCVLPFMLEMSCKLESCYSNITSLSTMCMTRVVDRVSCDYLDFQLYFDFFSPSRRIDKANNLRIMYVDHGPIIILLIQHKLRSCRCGSFAFIA